MNALVMQKYPWEYHEYLILASEIAEKEGEKT